MNVVVVVVVVERTPPVPDVVKVILKEQMKCPGIEPATKMRSVVIDQVS